MKGEMPCSEYVKISLTIPRRSNPGISRLVGCNKQPEGVTELEYSLLLKTEKSPFLENIASLASVMSENINIQTRPMALKRHQSFMHEEQADTHSKNKLHPF